MTITEQINILKELKSLGLLHSKTKDTTRLEAVANMLAIAIVNNIHEKMFNNINKFRVKKENLK